MFSELLSKIPGVSPGSNRQNIPTQYYKINVNWIPGYQEYEGNKRVGYLAKSGSLQIPFMTKYPSKILVNKMGVYYLNLNNNHI